MRVLFRAIKGRAGHPKFTAIADEVRATIEAAIKPELIAEFNKRVKNWTHKPEFKAKTKIDRQGISVYVYPTGENADIWNYVSGGTRAHEIKPKGKGYPLRFVWGGKGSYVPKTTPRGGYGGPGVVRNGQEVRAMAVNHPGNKPRNFEARIEKSFTPRFKRIIENAMRRGARRV